MPFFLFVCYCSRTLSYHQKNTVVATAHPPRTTQVVVSVSAAAAAALPRLCRSLCCCRTVVFVEIVIFLQTKLYFLKWNFIKLYLINEITTLISGSSHATANFMVGKTTRQFCVDFTRSFHARWTWSSSYVVGHYTYVAILVNSIYIDK